MLLPNTSFSEGHKSLSVMEDETILYVGMHPGDEFNCDLFGGLLLRGSTSVLCAVDVAVASDSPSGRRARSVFPEGIKRKIGEQVQNFSLLPLLTTRSVSVGHHLQNQWQVVTPAVKRRNNTFELSFRKLPFETGANSSGDFPKQKRQRTIDSQEWIFI